MAGQGRAGLKKQTLSEEKGCCRFMALQFPPPMWLATDMLEFTRQALRLDVAFRLICPGP